MITVCGSPSRKACAGRALRLEPGLSCLHLISGLYGTAFVHELASRMFVGFRRIPDSHGVATHA